MKTLFHDEEDGNPEPTPGLPEDLPAGERVLWQGKPNGLTLAVHALHIRFVAIYIAVFTIWRIAAIAARDGATSEMANVVATSFLGAAIGGGLLYGLAWLMARSTIYTITNRRIVFRYGVGIRKYVNIPFSVVEAASLKRHGAIAGSIALSTTRETKIAYLHLWPHVRPWRYAAPQPMLRALTNAEDVAAVLCKAIKQNAPSTVNVTLGSRATVKSPLGGAAASPA